MTAHRVLALFLSPPQTADTFDALFELATTETSYALVEEDGAIVGIRSGADYANALELRWGLGTVGERDQSVPMTETGDVSAPGR